MSIASTLGKAGSSAISGIKKAVSSPAGKIAATSAAVGGGSYVALSGTAAGVEKINDATGLSSIIKLVNPEADNDGSRGAGTLIGIGLAVVLALLLVFVIIPKAKGGAKRA